MVFRRTPKVAHSSQPWAERRIRGLYQELRGYLGKPGRHRGRVIAPTGEELTYARYGLYNYVPTEKQRREPYASLHRAGATLRGLIRILRPVEFVRGRRRRIPRP